MPPATHLPTPTLGQKLNMVITDMVNSGITLQEAKSEFDKRFITVVLIKHGGNMCKAAKELNRHRNSLSRDIIKYRIDLREIKQGRRKPARPAVTSATGDREESA